MGWQRPHMLGAFIACVLGALPAASSILLRQAPNEASGGFSKREVKAMYVLEAIYKGRAEHVNETGVQAGHAHADVYGGSGDAAASVYGEIKPEAVVEMLKVTGMKEGQKYYDLGSGYGKTVVLSWLLGLNATGIELAQNRWDGSCAALRRAPELGISGGSGVRFLKTSFLEVDWSDADLVFMDSVMFSEETMKALANQARRLRPGTKVVSSHQGLPGPGFKDVGVLRGAVSWSSRKSNWKIQAVTNSAATYFEPVKKSQASHDVCAL